MERNEIIKKLYAAYGTDSGILFGISESKIVEAIVHFALDYSPAEKEADTLRDQMDESLKLYENQNNTILRLQDKNKQLIDALKAIKDRTVFLDNGVNDKGDKQISSIWEIAHEAILKIEANKL